MKKNKKKLIAVIVAVAVVLVVLAAVLIIRAVRNRRPPELEEIRDRIEELVEASAEINMIFWGEGLPTYPRVYQEQKTFTVTHEGEERTRYYSMFPDDELGTVVSYQYYITLQNNDGTYKYYDFEKDVILSSPPTGYYRYARQTEEKEGDDYIYYHEETGHYYYALTDFEPDTFFYTEYDETYYDYVRENCGYLSTDDIKAAAAKVYSSVYLASVNESIFTGIAVSDRDSGTLAARYIDYEVLEGEYAGSVYLVKSNQEKGYELTDWVYDYDTMEMVSKSNATFVTIEVERYPADDESARETVKLYFTLENGQWYLDGPSY